MTTTPSSNDPLWKPSHVSRGYSAALLDGHRRAPYRARGARSDEDLPMLPIPLSDRSRMPPAKRSGNSVAKRSYRARMFPRMGVVAVVFGGGGLDLSEST